MNADSSDIHRLLDEAFAGLPVELPPPAEPDVVHARHLYTLAIECARAGISRDTLMDRLHRLNIGAGVHFIGAHLQPYYAGRFRYRPEDFPNATWISERTLSLPLSARLSDEDVDDVIGAVRHALG